MDFVPVTKEDQKKSEDRVSVNLSLSGESAVKFKAMCDQYKLSGVELSRQMAESCVKNYTIPFKPKT